MCSTLQTGVSTTTKTVSSAMNFWGIIKGIAEAAGVTLSVLDPPLGLALSGAVATAQGVVDALTDDANAIQAVYDQGHTVLALAAPYFNATPKKTA